MVSLWPLSLISPRKKMMVSPKMMGDNDVKAYCTMFEPTAEHKDWDPQDWAWLLAPVLTGEAHQWSYQCKWEHCAQRNVPTGRWSTVCFRAAAGGAGHDEDSSPSEPLQIGRHP